MGPSGVAPVPLGASHGLLDVRLQRRLARLGLEGCGGAAPRDLGEVGRHVLQARHSSSQ